MNLSYLDYLHYLDKNNPKAADLHDNNLRLAAQGYIDTKSIIADIGKFLYSSFFRASLKMIRDIRINKKSDQIAGADMCDAFSAATMQASKMLQDKFPGYRTPTFHELTCLGPATQEQFKDYDAFYNPSMDKTNHIVLLRFFTIESTQNRTFEAKKYNRFLSDIEHELTHFYQAKDYLFKTNENGELVLPEDEFKRRTKIVSKIYKDEAKKWMIRDPRKMFEMMKAEYGQDFTEKDYHSLLPIIHDLIKRESPSLWDRNDPREVSAHIGDILRQLPPPTENDLASRDNFFKYLEKSTSFKGYILMVSNPKIKKKFLSSLYSTIQNKKDDLSSFQITDCATDEIFPDEVKMQEKLEKDLSKSQTPSFSPQMKSMQPMQKKKKK